MNQPDDVPGTGGSSSWEPARDCTTPDAAGAGTRRRRTLGAATKRRALLSMVPLAGAVMVALVIGLMKGGWGKTDQRLEYATVKRAELPIEVLERGALESREKIDVLCEVESLGGRSGYFGGGSSTGLSGVGTSGRMGSFGSVRAMSPVFRVRSLSSFSSMDQSSTASSTDTSESSSSSGASGSSQSGGSYSSGRSGGYSQSSQSGGGSGRYSSSSGRMSGSSSGFQSEGFTSYDGTQILYVAPNGATVKKGDVLVELDSAPLRDRIDTQFLDTERAAADQIKATMAYENQKTRNENSLANAQLRVKLSELALRELNDSDVGTFQIAMDRVDMQIKEALASQLIQETKAEGVEVLYDLGYKSKSELASERLGLLSAERALAIQLSGRKDVLEFQYESYKLQLEGALATANRSLQQVQRNNAAQLAQAKARKDAADRVLFKEKERLERYQTQLEKCKIVAPRDGIVAYASERGFLSSYSLIAEGATVREQQKILTLPVLDRMDVRTAVHESVRNEIKAGMPATVRIDGIPRGVYQGTVASVAVMPNVANMFGSDTQVYDTVISIDQKVTGLKPGMTAVVEIHAGRVKNVLCAPLQSVVEIDGEHWCYVEAAGGLDRRRVALGRTNARFVEIREGLKENDRVVLAPVSCLEDARNRDNQISPER